MADVVPPIHVPEHEATACSAMATFTRWCQQQTGAELADYGALHAFSVRDFRRFWALLLRWSGLPTEGSAEPVCVGDAVEQATFFPELRLSYAECLLGAGAPEADSRVALTACCEDGSVTHLTRAELRDQVLRAAAGLRALGVRAGDHVVAIARNTAESVVACLACVGLGATWSSTSPDQGTESVLRRFQQLDPTLLLAHTSYPYQSLRRALGERIQRVLKRLPTVRGVVWLDEQPQPPEDLPVPGVSLAELLTSPALSPQTAWPRLPFNHPLFILFSSGTTGPPKCIVHTAGGTLLQHVKEHRLHSGLGSDDTLYFHTSCGWMMWNWQLSALASGTRVVLYDGSPTYPEPDALWRLVAEQGVTVFGTSPPYLQYCADAGIEPSERVDLARLRAMQSTGSILFDRQFVWVRDHVGALPVQSISGGTDIIGCFVLGNPDLPVWSGECQCLGLGMDVRAWRTDPSDTGSPSGALTELGAPGRGELVCATPFPSRPLGLHGDTDGSRFHAAYFADHPGLWTHGDTIEITERHGVRMLGRSDGVLNLRGVRVGPAEIYQVLQGVDEVAECMAVEQPDPRSPGGSRLALLVVLRQGEELDRPLTLRIKRRLRDEASPVHVPAVIAAVSELPTTFSGKRSEVAARAALAGRPVANAAALRNPGCLDELRGHPALGLR